jgi:hypothetical protein
MDILNFSSTTFTDNLLGATNSLITQPKITPSFNNMIDEQYLSGGGKTKKSKDKSIKPKKEIDTYKKDQLVKIAKKHDVSLKARDGKVKTKEQLFSSLKRKKLLK